MKKYRVFINGQNFLLALDGKAPQRNAFYTTRYVEVNTSEKAESIAIKLIKDDKDLTKIVLNEQNNPPMLFAEEIKELESFEGIDVPGAGYTFYVEDEDNQE